MNIVKGIDTSHWTGKIDWVKAAAEGIQFMSTKITEGTAGLDLSAPHHVEKAKDAGLLVGGYHFFHPSMDGEVQANFFIQECPEPLDWYALDFESHDNTPAQVQLDEVQKFLDVIGHLTGKMPFVYLSTSFAEEIDMSAFALYPLWLANYNAVPKVPKPWLNYSIWQNSESGTAGGVGVDTDIFNGDIVGLKKLFGVK